MMKTLPLEVNMTEFRENLSAYLDAVEKGKTVKIMRRGKPSALLTGAEERVEAIDLNDLEIFRNSLNVKADNSVIVDLRRDKRY